MKTTTEIINAYAHGELTLAECNAKLAAIGSSLMLDPNRNKLTPEMAAQGYCYLDTGTGPLDVVQVKNGRLVGNDTGEMVVFVLMDGKWHEVKENKVL